MRGGVTAALAVLLALSTAATTTDAPLGVGTPGTFRSLFLDVTGADARGPGQAGWEARWYVANDWSTPTALVRGGRRVEVRDDEQADALTLSARFPWARAAADGAEERPFLARVSTSVEWRALAHWGGYSDTVVEAWHRFGHYTNFERQRFPRGEVHVAMREPGGRALVEVDGATFTPGDVTLRNQVLLAEGGVSRTGAGSRYGLSARLDLKLPVGSLDRLGGSGGADAAVGLLGTAELTSWLTGHALLAASAWSPLPAEFALQPRRWHGTAELSLAARLGSFGVVLEDRLVTPMFEGGWALDASSPYQRPSTAEFSLLRFHNQITVGLRRGPVTMWFSEDFTPGAWGGPSATWFYDSNAPDIVFGLSVQHPL
jgi:hypothetical protein